MRYTLLFFITLFSCAAFAQVDNPDFENLVRLGELYSKNSTAKGIDFRRAAESLRTPDLNPVIDVLLMVGRGDEDLLSTEILRKPNARTLKYWYVLREIQHNCQLDKTKRQHNAEVAEITLASNIDTRWLLDNYYYQLHQGIANLFNERNLSQLDFDLNAYGLANQTERAILFFNIFHPLTQRFVALQNSKKEKDILTFADKMPSFNGKSYYEYTDFEFEDFEWMGANNQVESYKQRHLGNVFSTLNAHISALGQLGREEDLRRLYFNSILYQPVYFPYSGIMQADLVQLHSQSRRK